MSESSPQSNPNTSMDIYHKHIISDINRLQDRAKKFIGLRVDFIRQKCKPIEERIAQLKKEIVHYRTVEQTSEQTIEERQDVRKLRQDIDKYQSIGKYYEKHVDQLERALFRQEDRQIQLQARLEELREQYRGFKRQDALELRAELEHSVIVENELGHKLTPKSTVIEQREGERKERMLPHVSSTAGATVGKQETLKAKVRDLLGEFNQNDRLIKDCFEVKKAMVQRMIGQLQSRLVKKKKLFVRVCEAISRKQLESVSLEEFKQLDADEIFTLVISFPSFTRKFEGELQAKRQRTVEISRMIR